MKLTLLALPIALATLVACNNKSTNPRLQAPAEKIHKVELAAGQTKTISEPKVNILFVVDNSGSMKAHQDKMLSNLDLFANRFFNSPRIAYRIGVVPVYDRVYLNDTNSYGTSGVRKMNPLGELVSLKDKNGDEIEGVPYITRDTPDAKNVLKNTVALGIQWGPEAEESFSPVIEVISNQEKNKTVNGGFYEKDAHLVVIFLTDADDVTPSVSADDFYEFLVEEKGGNESKVLIAAALPSAKTNSARCRVDGNGPQYKFPALIARSGAIVADLCSNTFGQTLAMFGEQLVQTVGSQVIQLDFVPDMNFTVSYGAKGSDLKDRQIIPRAKKGYTFNPELQQIILSSDLAIQRIPDGQLFVEVRPASLRNIQNGRTRTHVEAAALKTEQAAKAP